MHRDDSNPPDRTSSVAPEPSEGRTAEQAQLRHLQRERQTRVAKVAVALLLVGVLIAFIVANSQSVVVHFVFFTRRPALIWVMFACAVIGGIVGYLIGRPGRQIRPRGERDSKKKP